VDMVAAMMKPTSELLPALLQESRQLSQQARERVLDPLLATCLALDRLAVDLRSLSPAHAKEIETHLHSIRASIRAMSTLESEFYPTLLADLGLEAALLHIKEQFKQEFPDCSVDCLIDLQEAAPNFVQSAAICRLVSVTLAQVQRTRTALAVSIRVTQKESVLLAQIQEDHGRKNVSAFSEDMPNALSNLAHFVKTCGGEFDYKVRRGGPRVSASWQQSAMWTPWSANAEQAEK
jgi:signal transduction histidine kinase